MTPNLLCLPQVLGHTEWIKDCPNPKFKTLIECEYHFEKKQVPTASKVPKRAPPRLPAVAPRRAWPSIAR